MAAAERAGGGGGPGGSAHLLGARPGLARKPCAAPGGPEHPAGLSAWVGPAGAPTARSWGAWPWAVLAALRGRASGLSGAQRWGAPSWGAHSSPGAGSPRGGPGGFPRQVARRPCGRPPPRRSPCAPALLPPPPPVAPAQQGGALRGVGRAEEPWGGCGVGWGPGGLLPLPPLLWVLGSPQAFGPCSAVFVGSWASPPRLLHREGAYPPGPLFPLVPAVPVSGAGTVPVARCHGLAGPPRAWDSPLQPARPAS